MMTWTLSLYFFFYLLNYAELTRPAANWLRGKLGSKLAYPLSCGFCWPFWTTFIASFFFADVTFWWVLTAPVLHLLLDLTYQRLSGNCPPCLDTWEVIDRTVKETSL